MDTIDLYQIHRWDNDTPIDVTLRALDDAVRRGKVRYIGASSMWAHQFADALHTSDLRGLDRFVTMQNHYNLAYREEEREMLPLCETEDIGVIPWSPLARGYLTRSDEDIDATARGESERRLYEHPYREGGGPDINERVGELAAEKGVTMAQLALAWILHKEWVTAPIVGTTNVSHLEDAVAALDISLTESDIQYLEEPYEPVRVSGHE
jgi:aryl-alcohol dehydrogenase-like predicted oxidoreductase